MSNHAKIEVHPGKIAPRHEKYYELKLEQVDVTENGTQGDLPIVDFVCTLPNGEKALLMLTGRIVNGISAVVRGVNLRNHGVEEP